MFTTVNELTPEGFTKLDPSFKSKWTAALRSGEYRQGNGRLRIKVDNHYEYCCVGVACNIWSGRHDWSQDGDKAFIEADVEKVLPAYAWRGHNSATTESLPFLNDATFRKLATLNDSEGWNFERIADWIDVHL